MTYGNNECTQVFVGGKIGSVDRGKFFDGENLFYVPEPEKVWTLGSYNERTFVLLEQIKEIHRVKVFEDKKKTLYSLVCN